MNPIAKIGFLIKGDYDPAVTYDFLDVVFYNGASYVAKKLTTGNTPVRKNEYWQIFAEGGTLTGTSDISDTTVAFQQAQERVNISTGESAKTLFGKIKKWFADLKGTAFSAPVTNLFATVTGNSLDATMGKNLKDLHDANKNEINALNASLNGKFATVTGVFGDTLNIGTIIQYPSNFTRQNTVVIAQHYVESTSLRDQFYGSNLAMTVTLRTNNIEITPRNSVVFGHSFKIVLMRIA